jgi:hypothetical protein
MRAEGVVVQVGHAGLGQRAWIGAAQSGESAEGLGPAGPGEIKAALAFEGGHGTESLGRPLAYDGRS